MHCARKAATVRGTNTWSHYCTVIQFILACLPLSSLKYDTKTSDGALVLKAASHVGCALEVSGTSGRRGFKSCVD